MKKADVIITFTLLTALICIANSVTAQLVWKEKDAAVWVAQGEWKEGLKLNLDSSADKMEFARQYHSNPMLWQKVIAFLRDSDLAAIKPGKYIIDGENAYTTVTYGPDKDFDKTGWESHKKYIDLQYVIAGKEKMGLAPITSATVIKPYNEQTDAANYTAEGKYLIAAPGTFLLFFPQNAHRPGIKVDGDAPVKKLVIKIRYSE